MSSQNKIKPLLVDEELDFLQAIAERLRLKDFDVVTASTGEEAIASADNELFDLAVVDFQMPGMDGTQVLKALKDRHRYLEIIMLTGHATIDSAVENTKLGALK
jgi:DNA-binding NtrC family response regulator